MQTNPAPTPHDASRPSQTVVLVCHPATPTSVVSGLQAEISWLAGGDLALRYCLRGDMARLRIPDDAEPTRTDQLWEHTCFEAFIGRPGSRAYCEFNFSPSSQWARYTFADYRQRTDDPTAAATDVPRIATRRFAGRLELDVTVPASLLPPRTDGVTWQIGLTAVVESDDAASGCHSYWALAHPTPRPDFHHRDGHTLQLDAEGDAA